MPTLLEVTNLAFTVVVLVPRELCTFMGGVLLTICLFTAGAADNLLVYRGLGVADYLPVNSG